MWAKLKQLFWQWRIVLIIGSSVAIFIIGLRLIGLLQSQEVALLDQFFRWRPAVPADSRIVLVEITEADIEQWGYPINDATLARVLEALKQQQPRVIGLDLFRDLPVEPGHAELVKVFNSTPNLIGIRKVAGGVVNPPPELNQLGQVAANDLVTDPDGKIRRGLVSLDDQEGQTIQGLGTALALQYLQAENIEPRVVDSAPGQIEIGKSMFFPLRPNDGGYINIDLGGYQILGDFRNLSQGFQRISLTHVLQGQMPADLMRDRMVVIGVSAESIGDFFLTPLSSGWFSRLPVRFSGVAIHADLASQILDAAIAGRSPMRFWAKSWENAGIVFCSFIGASICWSQRYRRPSDRRKRSRQFAHSRTAIALVLVVAILLVGSSYVAFLHRWWIPVMPALLALFISALMITGYVAQMATSMRQTFGRYLSDEVVANLLETPQGLKLGGEERKVTMLISDLRGFSAIAVRVTPEESLDIINLYLRTMTDVINHYKGLINEFIGDGIFVLFGAPIQRTDDSQRAIACAISMQLAMGEINAQLADKNLPTLEMGIGVHTGTVLAGNIGSDRRAKYTVIGSNVNLASRIETYTVGGQILASKDTLNDVGAILRIDGQLRIQLKGFQDEITLYEIGGIGGNFNVFLPKQEEMLVPLKQKLPIQLVVVEEKHLTKEVFHGTIVKLTEYSAEIHTDRALGLLTNLQLNLLVANQKAKGMGDIYAKVIARAAEDPTLMQIRFTAVPPEVASLFYYLWHSAKTNSQENEARETNRVEKAD
ncbi:putative transmembrane sensor domain protein [Leptolyngbyaceae cyanobacterium JSC-12]|nr:putative transmembrane sensor domain protein [Leptolyngbyaceae cyanobacterium JSC-12]